MIKRLYFSRVSQSKASENDIANAERECGFKFPTAFREFCHTYNGGYPDERNEFYPVPKKFSAFHAENREDGVLLTVLYGLGRDSSPWNVLEMQEFVADLKPPLFALMGDPFGNTIVVEKGNPEGPVFFRDHELWDGPETPHLFQVADTLEEFYNGLGIDPIAKDYADE